MILAIFLKPVNVENNFTLYALAIASVKLEDTIVLITAGLMAIAFIGFSGLI